MIVMAWNPHSQLCFGYFSSNLVPFRTNKLVKSRLPDFGCQNLPQEHSDPGSYKQEMCYIHEQKEHSRVTR